MNSLTESLLRRAAQQAATLTRHSRRCLMSEAQKRTPQEATSYVVSEGTDTATNVKTIHDLPGPSGLPVLGTAFEYFRKDNRGQMHEVQRRFHSKYGRMFREQLGPKLNLSVADARLVEEIFRHDGKYPNRPPYESWILYKEMRKRSRGIVSANGEEWRKIRSLLNHKLMKPRQLGHYSADIDEVSNQLTSQIKVLRDPEGTSQTVPNFINLLYAWSIECVSLVLLDKRLGCLHQDLSPVMQDFVKAIADLMYTGHQLMVFAGLHKKFNTKIWRKQVNAWDTILRIAEQLIDNKVEEMKPRMETMTFDPRALENVTFLEYLFANKTLENEEIYTNVTELLMSGVDTTSNTVAMTLHLLAKHPHVQEKTVAEVQSVLGDGPCTMDKMKSLSYLKAVVKETLRCYPIIPINARVLSRDVVVDGYQIPKDTIVLLNTYTMCRDPEHFTNPDEFIPERWLRNESREDFSPFSALPFGFGARSCVGRRIAEHMSYISISNILRNFKLESTPEANDVKPFVRTVMTLGDQIPVRFVDR